jgi:hypothetical protein
LEYEKRDEEIEIQKMFKTKNLLHGQIQMAQSDVYKWCEIRDQTKKEVYEIRSELSNLKQMMHDIKNEDNFKQFENKLFENLKKNMSTEVSNILLIILAFFEAFRKNPFLSQILHNYYQRFRDDNIKEDLKLKQDYIFLNCMSLLQDFAEKFRQVYSNKAISDLYQSHNTKTFL